MLSLGNKLTLTTQPIYKFVNKYSIDFDGVDDRIITDGADTVAQNSTYSFWSKSSETGENKGVFGHGTYYRGAFHFNYSSDKPRLYYGGGFFVEWNDTSAQDDGEWHHWVVYVDINTLSNSKLYCDGVLQTGKIVTTGGVLADYTQSLTIGSDAQSGSNSFVGQIDEFAVYDRELTQAEITRMYNTYYSPNRVANGNFSQIGNEEVTNGDFSQIGSELVTNGDFATDSNWSGSYSIVNSQLTKTANGLAYQGINAVSGTNFFKVVVDVAHFENFLKVYIGGTQVNLVQGINTLYIQAGGLNNFVGFNNGYNTGTNTGAIINSISVKEVGQDFIFGTGWGMGDGKAVCDGSQTGNTSLQQSGVALSGKIYKIQFDLIVDAGFINYVNLGGWIDNTNLTTTDTYTYYTTTTTNTDNLGIAGDSNFVGSIDNISVKEVGQHWTVSNSDADNYVVFNGSTARVKFLNTSPITTLEGSFLMNAGKTYKLIVDIASVTSGSIKIDGAGLSELFNTAGVTTRTLQPTGNTGLIFYRSSADVDLTLNSVILQELKHDATNLMLNAGAYQSANPLITSTKSMEFDGTDDYLQLSEPFSHTNHTITGWFKTDDNTDTQEIFSAADSSDDGIRVWFDGSSILRYRIGDSGASTLSSGTLVANKWYNFACTYDGTTQTIYIDGVSVINQSASRTISTTTDVRIGNKSWYNADYFNGKITEVGAYNRCLTSLEVASLYNQGMPTNLLVNRNNYQSGNPTVFNTKQVDFDGTDDYLDLGNPSILNFTSDFTISMWIKSTVNSDSYIALFTKFSSGAGWDFFLSSGILGMGLRGTAGNVLDGGYTSTDLRDNKWHNVVAVNTNSYIKLYVDGVIVHTKTATWTPTTTTTNAYIGKRTGIDNFNGEISQVGLWNSTLTSDEVSSLYNHGLPIDLTTDQAAYASSSNLVGYWRMGSGTLDSYPLIADQTNATLSAEYVVNGDFSNGTTGWTAPTQDGAYQQLTTDGLKMYAGTPSGGSNLLSTTTTFNLSGTEGKVYKADIVSSDYVGGATMSLRLNGVYDASNIISFETGTQTVYFTAYQDFTFIRFFAGSFEQGFTLKSISIKEVGGNPAMMINLGGGADFSDGIKNGSPYANVIQNGTFDTNVDNWSGDSGATVVWQSDSTALVTTTADNNFAARQDGILTSGVTYKTTFRFKPNNTGEFRVRLGGSSYQFISSDFVVDSWNEVEFTAIADGSNIEIGSYSGNITNFYLDDVTSTEVNTGLQGYWKMGDGTNDEYPVIYDQTNPDLGSEIVDFPNATINLETGWSFTNGILTQDGTGSGQGASADAVISNTAFDLNKIYKFTITVSSYTSGDLQLLLNPSSNIAVGITKTGDYTLYGGFAMEDYLHLRAGYLNFVGSISNITIKQVQGNPATMTNMVEGNITNQYPLTKIRNYYRMGDGILDGYPIIQDQTSPNLAHIPTTNLFIYSEDLSQSSWFTSGVTLESGQVSPIGDTSAFKLTFSAANDYIQDDMIGLDTSKKYTISFYAKVDSGTTTIDTGNITAGSYEVLTVTDEWQRFKVTQTPSATTRYPRPIQSNGNDIIYLWGCQFEEQSQATAYIKSDGIAAVRKSSTTNLITYSEDFTQSSWNLDGNNIYITRTPNAAISPSGNNDATKLITNNTSKSPTYAYIGNSGLSATEPYTISVFAKKGEYDYLVLGNGGYGTGFYSVFNLSSGVISTQPTASSTFANIEDYSNGWYRCSVVTNNTSSGEMLYITPSVDGTITTNYTGTANGIYVWGAQAEEQTQAETYAKTTGLPVTIDLFTENNYGTMTNMSASDIVEDTPNN